MPRISMLQDDTLPFLKWAGGKYQILARIKKLLPPGKCLIEPFAGSGAVFLNTHYPHYWLNDINLDLITTYQMLQQQGEQFIDYCAQLFIPKNNQEKKYYALREEFNDCSEPHRRAALFIYFNRHGYNGLCRYNSKNQFNVPYGRYRQPRFPRQQMQNFYEKSQAVNFTCQSFAEVMLQATAGDIVYCDPPYVPLSKTSLFTCYSGNKFDTEQQQQLVDLAKQLSKKNIPVLISNHDTRFTKKIYADAKKKNSFAVRRSISCNTKNRTTVKEVLALFC